MSRDVYHARRAVWLRRFGGTVAALGLFTAILVGPAEAISGTPGGQLFWNGGTVTVDVEFASASFNSDLYLYPNYTDAVPDFSGSIKIAKNCNTSQALCDLIDPIMVAIPSSMDPGDELVFGIEVNDTNQRYLMGPGSRNP